MMQSFRNFDDLLENFNFQLVHSEIPRSYTQGEGWSEGQDLFGSYNTSPQISVFGLLGHF